MSLATLFDYDMLDVETRIVVQQKTGEIKDRVRRSRQDILEIGERLIEIKERLGHGSFGRWLEVEFGWSDRFARDLMNVAEVFKSELSSDLDITPTALRSLAAPSVPEPARQEAIESARNGQHVGTKEAVEIIARHKPESPKPVELFDPGRDARERAAVESRPADTEEPEDEDEPDAGEPEADEPDPAQTPRLPDAPATPPHRQPLPPPPIDEPGGDEADSRHGGSPVPCPEKNTSALELIEAARHRNHDRDAADHSAGVLLLRDCPTDARLATIYQALECGIATSDWGCVAEAAAMLDDMIQYGRDSLSRAHAISRPPPS